MVAILVSPHIRRVLQDSHMDAYVEETGSVSTVAHRYLVSAVRTLTLTSTSSSSADASSSTVPVSLKLLLKETSLYPSHADAVAQLQPPRRNPDVERRVIALRRRLEDKQYAHMIRDVSRTASAPSLTASTNADLENIRLSKLAPQMSLGLNVVVTMATCFTAAYYVFKASSGSQTVGLIAGVVALIVAMIVEAILLVTKMYSIDDALRRREKNSRSNSSKAIAS